MHRKSLGLGIWPLFELCPYGIWNIVSLITQVAPAGLNFVPMGFETRVKRIIRIDIRSLNFVPMGFETYALMLIAHGHSVWTLSLWDLKLVFSTSSGMKICLNFVPMGFETNGTANGGVVFDVWTLSLWDLKLPERRIWFRSIPFELCPYGIWNSRRKIWTSAATMFELCPYGIWNLASILSLL